MVPVSRPKNGLAIASMITSISGAAMVVIACCCVPVLTGLLAIGAGATGAILGHVALNQLRRHGGEGRPFALTGVIVGWIAAGIGVLLVVVSLLVLGLDVYNYYWEYGEF